MIFPLLIPITIIRTQKMRNNRKHIPFHLFVIGISIYTNHKSKMPWRSSVHKLKKLPQRIIMFYYTNSKASNRDLWRWDLLSNCYEFSSVALMLSHEPNASNRTRNRLWTGEKRALDWVCRLQRQSASRWYQHGAADVSRGLGRLGLEPQLRVGSISAQLEPMAGRLWTGSSSRWFQQVSR